MAINVVRSGPYADDWACEKLHRAIELDGRSVERYAEEFLFAGHSSVYKWLRGDNRIPKVYRKMLSPALAELERTNPQQPTGATHG